MDTEQIERLQNQIDALERKDEDQQGTINALREAIRLLAEALIEYMRKEENSGSGIWMGMPPSHALEDKITHLLAR